MATKPPTKQTAKHQASELARTLDDSEEEIQTDAEVGQAHDLIASLLTRHRGEYVFRIGALPTLSQLMFGEPIEGTGWVGVTRSQAEVDKIHEMTIKVVEQMGGKVSTLFEARTDHPRVHLLLRLPPLSVSDVPEVRCAVVGNVDSGKSTTLGVLTRGALDDGRGRARVALFRHKHEVESGRTSSVGMEILGFRPEGSPILPASTHIGESGAIRQEKIGWEEISKESAKIISFIVTTDLAGHEKYLKTTLYGLTSGSPSCVILIVGANAGLIGMSKEHLAAALALTIPVIVCITKIDMTPPNVMEETVKQVVKILRSPGCRKTPVFVKSAEVAMELAPTFATDKLCPVFKISNVTGEGLDHMRTLLNLLPPSDNDKTKYSVDQPFEYSVTEVWSVPFVGTVVNGIVASGSIKAGETVLMGPDANGNYLQTSIKSMQKKRASVTSAEAGQTVSLALKRTKRQVVRKGMVIVKKMDEPPPRPIYKFEGQVLILYHNTTLQKGYQAMLHCGAVRQTVRITAMDHPQGVLRTGDRATVQFQFITHPEHMTLGSKILFREGTTKGLGVVTKLL
ncbi:P-loop containing nucleoside triphosphate hydrolase protein [Thelephora terrestris]|uniref:P-loop containing nucleoside triphosphate hydrolase protein n=1 Tax=Thelephora terrestris TaxID=56493 RepID=A0A9P6LCG2_9AGAM|nr:P-loop containing nucleoside triphosphate hydrolase protein [Thelephora terrestris]